MKTVRLPAVSGFFYEGDARRLRQSVESQLSARPRWQRGSWRALLLPHAGHVYSGHIAGLGVSSVEWPATVLLLGPNHRGHGARAAVSPADAWRTPLGDVPVDASLASDLLAASDDLERDDSAHAAEHALEVILPFLQVARPDVSVVCVSIGEPELALCTGVGHAVATVVKERAATGREVAIVVSSDLNHYLPKEKNARKDESALEALTLGDPEELFERVLYREQISMCGILPATALLSALAELGPSHAVVLAHGDSADAGGDADRVVGYASVVWETKERTE